MKKFDFCSIIILKSKEIFIMLEFKWIVKFDGTNDELGKFDSCEEGIDGALRFLSTNFVGMCDIINNELNKHHTKICESVIQKFLDFEKLRTSNIRALLNEYEDKSEYYFPHNTIEEGSFTAEMPEDSILTVRFGDALHIETNILGDKPENEEYFIFVSDKTNSIKLYINKIMPQIANIFLVYKALTTVPQTRAEIRSKIIYEYGKGNSNGAWFDIDISDDTISNQIKALKDLGFPIYDRRLNESDRKIQDDLIYLYGNQYKEGFYLDYNRPITPDYSKLKPGSYIMLVYLTLKEIDKAHALSTQQEIIDAVKNKFGVTLQRQKVKNYLDLLIELGSGIQHDEVGYWMKG